MDDKLAGEKFAQLLATMEQLRGENGCPWDKEQTHSSLRSFLLEETHELLDALDGDNPAKICEELGDVLHQIVFHCQIASERGAFTAVDMITKLNDKMMRRHPHVFSGQALPDTAAVIARWAEIKAGEETDEKDRSALGNLPRSMPALARAQKISERASRVGFDWPAVEPVWEKVDEELHELKAARAGGSKARMKDEIGDLFFALVNLARFLVIDAEDSLNGSTAKFIERFKYMEARLQERGKSMTACSLAELDELWEEAKVFQQRAKTGHE